MHRRHRLAAVVAAIAVHAAAVAAAQPPGLTARTPQKQGVWYGHQIVIADVLAAAVFVAGAAAESEAAWVGLIGMSYSGPVAHALHGNTGRAITSWLLIRPVGIAGGAVVGFLAAESCDADKGCELTRIALGAVGGMAIATALDVSIAYENVVVAPMIAGRGDIAGLTLATAW